MPCMGPTSNQNKADSCTIEILELMKTKYHVGNGNNRNDKWTFDEVLKGVLQDIVRQIFKSDSFNGF